MNKTYWTEKFYVAIKCDWCRKDFTCDIHAVEDDIVCRKCLETTEVEDDESLTLDERNR